MAETNAPEIVVMELKRNGKTIGVRYRKSDVPKGAKTVPLAEWYKKNKSKGKAKS